MDNQSLRPIRPLFVLGLQRSGTTWLANLLCSQPEIAGVVAEDHNGVHESIFFSHFVKQFSPEADPEQRNRMLLALQQSDYGVLSEVGNGWFPAQQSSGYSEIFRTMMEQVARRKGASIWLEKSPHHTLLADELRSRYPDALFIGVIRDDKSLIASRLYGFGRQPERGLKRSLDIIRGCLANGLYSRYLKRLAERDRSTVVVQYQHLLSDTERTLRLLLPEAGVKGDMIEPVSKFAANSSFTSGSKKKKALNQADIFLIGLCAGVFRLIPVSFLLWAERKNRQRRGVEWPEWCWKRSGKGIEHFNIQDREVV